MKSLKFFALFLAFSAFAACSASDTPFKVFSDAGRSLDEVEKFMDRGITDRYQFERSGDDRTFTDRILIYGSGESHATAGFSSDPSFGTSVHYVTYGLVKLSVEDFTFQQQSGGPDGPSSFDATGYELYELTLKTSGNAGTTSPREIRKSYELIKIDGNKLYQIAGLERQDDTFTLFSGEPTVYTKL